LEVQPHAYLTRSKYFTRLKEYFDLFDRKQILVLKSEDLSLRPHENFKKILEFLEVNASAQLLLPPKYSSPSVKDPSVQIELRNYFEDRFPDVIESIRKEKSFASLTTNDEDKKKFDLLRANLVESGKLSLTTSNRKLLKKLLAKEILCLKGVVGFPINDWV